MKRAGFYLLLTMIFFSGITVKGGEYTPEKLNLPGDNLNLYAVMNIFRESETLEEFEKRLNDRETRINNLDLNNDDRIDYIKVADHVNGDAHTIVLQVAVNKWENQDVAVFTVKKYPGNEVRIQLIGDQDLYGEDYIIEPHYSDQNLTRETQNPGYEGNYRIWNGEPVVITRTSYCEVASWPVITFIFLPTYISWNSPWCWNHYPSHWRPWRPFYWDYYYGYHHAWYGYYNGHYRHCHHYRNPGWSEHYYAKNRAHSGIVHHNRERGRYMATYSRPDLRNDGMRESSRNHSEGRKPPVRTGYTRTGGNHIRENTVVNTRNSSWTTRHEIRPAPRQEQGNRSGERVSGRKEGRYQAPQPPVRNWEKSASDRRTSPKVNVELNRNRHDNPAPARNTGRTNVKSESKGGQRSAPSHGSRTPSINP